MLLSDLKHVLDALEAAEAEFEELMNTKEWFVTDVIDRLNSAQEILFKEIINEQTIENGRRYFGRLRRQYSEGVDVEQ